MNRRGFLRGAISVMALAAVIKGSNVISSSHGHQLDVDTGKVAYRNVKIDRSIRVVGDEFLPGDWIRIEGNGMYRIKSVVNGVLTLG